jgi:hypothetical protein
LLFGTGAGIIYEFNKNGLMHSHEENGIFYNVFDTINKIIALSGTPLNSGGTANIIIFSNNYEKRNVLFSEETSGRTFVFYLKNDNLILVNIGGFYFGNDYSVIDVAQEKIIWTKQDCSSLMIPYKTISNGFEFIKADAESHTVYKNGDIVERYLKIKNIYIYQLILENNKDISINKLETNLIEFFDTTKKFSNLAAYCESKVLDENDNGNYGYDNYLKNLLSNGEILLNNSFPRLKELNREKGGKGVFRKIN